MRCPKCNNELSKHGDVLVCHICKLKFQSEKDDGILNTSKCEECGTFHYINNKCDCRSIK